MSTGDGVITSPLGPDKEIPDVGFAVTLFDGLKRHQPLATALVSNNLQLLGMSVNMLALISS